MVTVARGAHNAPDAECPTCGAPGKGRAFPQDDDTTKANYMCAAGHIWTTRWLTPAS